MAIEKSMVYSFHPEDGSLSVEAIVEAEDEVEACRIAAAKGLHGEEARTLRAKRIGDVRFVSPTTCSVCGESREPGLCTALCNGCLDVLLMQLDDVLLVPRQEPKRNLESRALDALERARQALMGL